MRASALKSLILSSWRDLAILHGSACRMRPTIARAR
jgi:hypothetical protein